MNKLLRTASVFLLTLAVAGGVASAKASINSVAGGYKISLPNTTEEILHTSTGFRALDGKALINIDTYSMPEFITADVTKYSKAQLADYNKLLENVQDFNGFKLPKTAAEAKLNKGWNDFTMDYTGKIKLPRNYIAGSATQVRQDKLLVVTVNTTKAEEATAKKLLTAITGTIKTFSPKYPEKNTLYATKAGYKLDLPANWHAKTLQSENVIFAKSISSLHHDEAILREVQTSDYSKIANATEAELAAQEKAFVDNINQYKSYVTVIKHEPVVISNHNGTIMESTNSIDLKKTFVIEGYLFSKNNEVYQLQFSTDDTINHDLKTKSYTAAINSFAELKSKKK